MAVLRANFGFYAGMIQGFIYTSSSWISSTPDRNVFQVYKGPIPTDANDFFDGYPVGGSPPGEGSPSSNLLAEWNNFKITDHTVPTNDPTLNVQEVVFDPSYYPYPQTVTAVGTGTASWWAMWSRTGSGGSFPMTTYGAVIGDVSLSGGIGSAHLDSLNLVAGTPVQLLHWAVKFQA